MPQASEFRCKGCNELVDITNQERTVKAKTKDGREYDRKVVSSHGYNQLNISDYGSRTTTSWKLCNACKGLIVQGKFNKPLGNPSMQKQWSETGFGAQ